MAAFNESLTFVGCWLIFLLMTHANLVDHVHTLYWIGEKTIISINYAQTRTIEKTVDQSNKCKYDKDMFAFEY